MMRNIEEGRVFHREGAIVCNGECDKVNPACKPICNVKSNVNVNVKSNVKSSQMSSQVNVKSKPHRYWNSSTCSVLVMISAHTQGTHTPFLVNIRT